jgi:uncharacterized protein
MGRFILLALAIFGLIWLLRRSFGDQPEAPRAHTPPGKVHGDLVRCAHCGLHLPRAEARAKGGLHYCSAEHERLGAGDGQ